MKTVKLSVRRLGHCPSFKNSKVLAKGRMFTKPEYQQWMDGATRAFESQLCCAAQTAADATTTEHLPLSLIAWSGQFDDSRQWIPEIQVKSVDAPRGDEGVDLEIEQL